MSYVLFFDVCKLGKLIFSYKDIKMKENQKRHHTKDDVSKCQKDKCLNG